jgi:hypothetical protein
MVSSKILKKVQNAVSYSYSWAEFEQDMEIYHNFQDFPKEVKDKIHTLILLGGGEYIDKMYAYYDVVDLAKTCLKIS